MGDRNATPVYPGRDTPSSMRSLNGRGAAGASAPKPYDPTEDDPLEHAQSVKSAGSEHSQYVVAPSIQVRPEFSSLTRSLDAAQALTCLVVLELPSKRGHGQQVPGPVMVDAYPQAPPRNGHGHPRGSPAHSPEPSSSSYRQQHQQHQYHHNYSDASDATVRRQAQQSQSPPRSQVASPTSSHQHHYNSNNNNNGNHQQGRYSPSVHTQNTQDSPYSPPGAPFSSSNSHSNHSVQSPEEESPFGAITEDLRNRIIDWKGHPLAGLGPLQMFDLLSVRRDALVREFFVYLFKEALICVAEEKKRSLGRFLSTASSGAASVLTDGGSMSGTAGPPSKGVLRLKGRIYIRHIRQVTDTSVQGELSLTIDMEDERLDSFILIFRDRSSLETWKANIQSLVVLIQRQSQPAQPPEQPPPPPVDLEEFGGSAKAARMLSGSTGTTTASASTGTGGADSLLNGGSSRSTMSSSTSHGSHGMRGSGSGSGSGYAGAAKLAPLEEDEMSGSGSLGMGMGGMGYASSAGLYTPHMSAGPSNSLTPLPHPPLDLILVVSLPAPNALQSTAALKLRVIRASLDFILASLAARDRLSLVTFEVGVGGRVRKTPFLSLGRTQSRARLAKFVDEIGWRGEREGRAGAGAGEGAFEDEFLVRGSKDEKTDVVTAVNHGESIVARVRLFFLTLTGAAPRRAGRRAAAQGAQPGRGDDPRERRGRQHAARADGPGARARGGCERADPLVRVRALARPGVAVADVEPHVGDVHVREGLVRPARLPRGVHRRDDVDRLARDEAPHEDRGREPLPHPQGVRRAAVDRRVRRAQC